MAHICRLLLVVCVILSGANAFIFGSKQVCYDRQGIGCFSTASPYDNAKGHLPESPDHIQVQYLLYTRTNQNTPQHISENAHTISGTHFRGSKKTKFIIHGFQDSGDGAWLKDMAHAFLRKEDVNVILVSWAKGADNINYIQAAANTRVVGALISQLMKALHVTTGAAYSNMHLIGHSLGSHIAGYAGERVHGTGRITGLDPAGPLFENQDTRVRLDPSDALFVDAIHTDGDSLHELGFGLERAVGHADFYPNGGDKQPGCVGEVGKHLFSSILTYIEKLKNGIACSHMRAIDFFTESINSHCHFQSQSCSSKANYDAGHCSTCHNGCANMGYTASHSHTHGKYYLTTHGNSPYCM